MLRDVLWGVLQPGLGQVPRGVQAGIPRASNRAWRTLLSGPIKRLLGRSSMHNIETSIVYLTRMNSELSIPTIPCVALSRPEVVQRVACCKQASLLGRHHYAMPGMLQRNEAVKDVLYLSPVFPTSLRTPSPVSTHFTPCRPIHHPSIPLSFFSHILPLPFSFSSAPFHCRVMLFRREKLA